MKTISQSALNELVKIWNTRALALRAKDSMYSDGCRDTLTDCAMDLESMLDSDEVKTNKEWKTENFSAVTIDDTSVEKELIALKTQTPFPGKRGLLEMP